MTRFISKSMLAALTASLIALPLQARDKIQIVGSELKKEISRLKHLVADLSLENVVLKNFASRNL